MQNKKSLLLIIVIFVLVAASLYLAYVIQDGSSPLALFNSRAAEDELFNELTNNDQGVNELQVTDPTPTITYNSTTPAVSGTIVVSPSAAPGLSPVVSPGLSGTAVPTIATALPSETPMVLPLPTDTPTIEYIGNDPIPTMIVELPVAGLEDYLKPALLGGGVLVLLALMF